MFLLGRFFSFDGKCLRIVDAKEFPYTTDQVIAYLSSRGIQKSSKTIYFKKTKKRCHLLPWAVFSVQERCRIEKAIPALFDDQKESAKKNRISKKTRLFK